MPGAQTGGPTTYMLNGKQYLLVAVSALGLVRDPARDGQVWRGGPAGRGVGIAVTGI